MSAMDKGNTSDLNDLTAKMANQAAVRIGRLLDQYLLPTNAELAGIIAESMALLVSAAQMGAMGESHASAALAELKRTTVRGTVRAMRRA